MPKSAGGVTVNFTAGTATFLKDVELANGAVRNFQKTTQSGATGSRTSMVAASTLFKELNGNFESSSRAVARLLIDVGGLGGAMSKIFPLVGGLAFLGMLYKIGEGIHKFYKDIEEAPKKIKAAFEPGNLGIAVAADDLRIAADKAEIEVAKLQGLRTNNLKLALDEAAKSADTLWQSLSKSVAEMAKLAKEHQPGWWQQNFVGVAGTEDITKGMEALNQAMDKIRETQRTAKREALRMPDQTAAAAMLKTVNDKANQDMNALLEQKEKDLTDIINEKPKAAGAGTIFAQDIDPAKRAARLALANAARERVQDLKDELYETGRLQEDDAKKRQAEEDAANRALGKPFADKVAALRAQLGLLNQEISAIGKNQGLMDQAKAAGLAAIAIEELNKRLKPKQKLTESQEQEIKGILVDITKAETEKTFLEGADRTKKALEQEVDSFNRLGASIGRGYEALKEFNVESKVAQFIKSHAADPDFLTKHAADIQGVRNAATLAFEAEYRSQIDQSLEKLAEQIAMEQALTAAIGEGEAAVRKAAEAERERQILLHNTWQAAMLLIMLERMRFSAEETKLITESNKKLEDRLQVIRAVTAATLQGAEAMRKAGNEVKYAQMNLDLKGSGDKQKEVDEAEHAAQVAADAIAVRNAHRDRIERLDEEIKYLKEQLQLHKDDLNLQVALQQKEKERLEQQKQLSLQVGTLRSGLEAFFLEVRATEKSLGQILYDSMTDALGRVADEFAKLITGQKVSFAKMAQEMGASLVRALALKELDKLIKKLEEIYNKTHGKTGTGTGTGTPGSPSGTTPGTPAGKAPATGRSDDPFTVTIRTGDPNGSEESPFMVIVKNSMLSGDQPGSGPNTPQTAIGQLLTGIAAAVVIGGAISQGAGAGPKARAEGGPVYPGGAYLVGERGPEAFIPQVSGTILSSAMTQRGLGGLGHTYYMSIDARGTDPVLTEQRVYKAIGEAHRDAVGTSVRATVLRSARFPPGR